MMLFKIQWRKYKLIKDTVPESIKKIYRQLKKNVVLISFFGRNVWCPCCKKAFRKFLPFGVIKRSNAKCPNCGALERHRLQILFLEQKTSLFTEPVNLLHFAPESFFFNRFSNSSNLRYFPVDLYPNKYPAGTNFVDITNINIGDIEFDVIICNHVLEHIQGDKKAMSELYRVLKPGGYAIIQVPLDKRRHTTYEDFRIVDPKEREKAFGQSDHVRVYGKDYKNRLEEVGFKVTVDRFTKSFLEKDILKYGILKEEDIYVCRKIIG